MELNELITDINTTIVLLFCAMTAYQYLYILVSIFFSPRRFKAKKHHRFAALICARNEEAVIGNLIENAFESMNSKGPAYDGKKELIFGIFSRPGGVLITVQDTGEGIKAENRQQIFENGFSTKGDGRGTGLYQVKSMVESLGGKICVESQEGVGASFCVKFGKEGI